jgi:hypothetical protein
VKVWAGAHTFQVGNVYGIVRRRQMATLITHHQPHQDARGIYNVEIVSLYHSFSFFGRSANVLAALPYGVGNFTGEVFSDIKDRRLRDSFGRGYCL